MDYANTVWSPIASDTNISKLQTTQNKAIRTITGCTLDTNTAHLHNETKILPIVTHLKLHASQLRQQAQHPSHNLHNFTQQPPPHRLMKQTVFHNNNYTHNLDTAPATTSHTTVKHNLTQIHSHIVHQHKQNDPINKILNTLTPDIHNSEQTLTHYMRRTLAQLRTNKSPILHSYLHKISPDTHPSPLCNQYTHDTLHLFNCNRLHKHLSPVDIWLRPVEAGTLVAQWREELGEPPGLS